MTLAIAATVQFRSPPQVLLVATSTNVAPDPIPQNTLITAIVRIHRDGTRHNVLTENAPRMIDGAWAWLDIHCPYNQGVVYEITAAGFTAQSITIYLPSQSMWLISASQASLSYRCKRIAEIGDRSTDSRAEKFTPIGRQAVFLTDGARDDIRGSFTLLVEDEQPIKDLIANDEVVLINAPGTKGWDLSWGWAQLTDVSFSNPGGVIAYPRREVKINYDICADPDVDLMPYWTSGVAEAYWTSQGIDSGEAVAKYANSLAGVTDTRL